MLRVAILWLALCAVSVAAWKRTQCGPGNLVRPPRLSISPTLTISQGDFVGRSSQPQQRSPGVPSVRTAFDHCGALTGPVPR